MSSSSSLFGGALGSNSIPLVKNLTSYLKTSACLSSEGLFRLSADNEQMEYWIGRLEQDPRVDMSSVHDPNLFAQLLKRYLRLLNPPIVTQDLYQSFLESCEADTEANIKARLGACVSKLPPLNFEVLSEVLQLLGNVVEYEDRNRMGVDNLATVMSPCLMGSLQDPTRLHEETQCMAHLIRMAPQISVVERYGAPPRDVGISSPTFPGVRLLQQPSFTSSPVAGRRAAGDNSPASPPSARGHLGSSVSTPTSASSNLNVTPSSSVSMRGGPLSARGVGSNASSSSSSASSTPSLSSATSGIASPASSVSSTSVSTPSSSSSSSSSQQLLAYARYDYKGSSAADTLSVGRGDVLVVLDPPDPTQRWFRCQLRQTGEEGLVPVSFLDCAGLPRTPLGRERALARAGSSASVPASSTLRSSEGVTSGSSVAGSVSSRPMAPQGASTFPVPSSDSALASLTRTPARTLEDVTDRMDMLTRALIREKEERVALERRLTQLLETLQPKN